MKIPVLFLNIKFILYFFKILLPIKRLIDKILIEIDILSISQ